MTLALALPWRRRGRVRTPGLLQMEAVECGAASLGIVLAHHGRVAPLEELRYACGVSRDGSKASNLIRAARTYGLKAKGLKCEVGNLRQMKMPMILFWNFNHFPVLEGFGAGKAFLNDPAAGRRTVTEEELEASFTGVALAFEPGPDFVKGGRRERAFDRFAARLASVRGAFVFVVLTSLFLVIPGLMAPAFSRIFVDFYLIQQFEDWLAPLIIGMAVTAVLRGFLTWLQQHYLTRLQTRFALAWSAQFMWHVLRLPVGFFAQRFSGEIGSRVPLNDRLAMLVGGELATGVLNLITVVFYALIMAQYNLQLTALAVSFALLNLVVLSRVSRSMVEISQKMQMDQGRFAGTMLQGIQLMESYKSSGTENLLYSRMLGHHAKVVNAEQEMGRRRTVLNAVPAALNALATAAILVVGGFQVMDGAMTIGTLVAFQALAAMMNAPVGALVGLGGQIQEAQATFTRLEDVLKHPVDPEFAPDRPEVGPPKLSGRLDIRDLTFGFSPLDPPLVEGFSLTVLPGQRVALVGRSGSGKSTLGKLIAGLHQPWSGEILFDGQPAAAHPRATFRQSVAMVDQEIALFEGTVTTNITLWDRTISEERVVAAAKDALIHEDIAERPDGYGHKVVEGGRNFSAGQCQRIEIARALAAEPALLVLDEATSALDATVEKRVVENLRRRGITCIIIAHRLSTIRDCDEIIVLDHGKVVQRGAHDDMMAAGGPYKALIEA